MIDKSVACTGEKQRFPTAEILVWRIALTGALAAAAIWGAQIVRADHSDDNAYLTCPYSGYSYTGYPN